MILRGAGEHRLLTFTNGITAIVNVILSIVLIRPFGLVGVALGTLIPTTAAAVLVLYPAACRRVNLPVNRPLREAFWPAVWPAVFMLATLEGLERIPPAGLIEVGIHLAVAGAVYAGLFAGVAIGANERRFYWTKIRSLLERRGRAPVAA
jgi:O-antigen/teichoic acid export membrane protein